MARIKDDELKQICHNELTSSTGYIAGELASERSQAMRRYMGEPFGDEVKGRSQVVTREVLETVEWIKPSLMRMFTDVDNAVEFSARNEDDEAAAEQETDLCTHAFFQQNDGFLNLYSVVTDALLSKTGVLKVWWDDTPEEEREEYEGPDRHRAGPADGRLDGRARGDQPRDDPRGGGEHPQRGVQDHLDQGPHPHRALPA